MNVDICYFAIGISFFRKSRSTYIYIYTQLVNQLFRRWHSKYEAIMVNDFLRVLRFLARIKMTTTIYVTEILLKVALKTFKQTNKDMASLYLKTLHI